MYCFNLLAIILSFAQWQIQEKDNEKSPQKPKVALFMSTKLKFV